MGTIQRVAGTLPIALDSHHSPARGFLGPRWVTFGRSRVRESRTLGSVGAKAEWLSYPTTTSTAWLSDTVLARDREEERRRKGTGGGGLTHRELDLDLALHRALRQPCPVRSRRPSTPPLAV